MNTKELTDLAIDVTGMTRDRWNSLCESMKSDQEMNKIMREDWHSKPRDSDEAIREYYRDSNIWFINTFLHGVGALVALARGDHGDLAPWARKFADTLRCPGGKILDFGGGLFKDSWPFTAFGYKIDVAEVSGPVTTFLKRFIETCKLENRIGIVEVQSETPIVDIYDGAISFETLEHLIHPEQFATHLQAHLKEDGLFAFSATFGAPEHAPYHVASNAPLGNGDVWAGVLTKIGFSHLWSDPNGGGTRIWKA